MNEQFKGKVSIITGAAAGIGRATAEAFANRGAVVILADIDGDGAARAAESINACGGRAEAECVDVSKLADMERLIHGARGRYGRLDYIFNNAGIGMLADLRDMSFTDWDRIIGINLYGVIYGTKLAYEIMAEQRSGHIINMASGSGLFPSPMRTGYNATKFGVVGLSHGLRAEAWVLGVKVSVVCPGVVMTDIFKKADAPNFNREKFLERLGRTKGQTPDEAAQEILAGVAKNRGIITLSPLVALLWRVYRFSPVVYEQIMARSVRSLYQYRTT